MNLKSIKLDNSKHLRVLDNESDKQPMIFIHGLTGNLHQLQFYYQHFKSNYRVIAVDLRGRGDSSPGDNSSNLNSHKDDIIQLINQLELNNPILVGYSMGGYVATLVASEIEIDKLIILDGSATMSDYQDSIVVPTFGRLSNRYESKEKYVDTVINNYSKMGVPKSKDLEKAVEYEIHEKESGWFNKANETTIRQDWASFHDFDVEDVGSKISVPTLLVQCLGSIGEIGPLFTEENYTRTKQAIKDIEVFQSNSNHYTLVFEPRSDVLDKITEFLDKRGEE